MRGLILCLVLLASACATASQRSSMLAEAENVEYDEVELRTVLYDTVYNFSRDVERAADEIARREGQAPEVMRDALLWKLGAATQAKRASFHPDAAFAFLDMWALAEQQRQFFSTGAGKDLFGASRAIAVETSEKLAEDVRQVAREAANAKGVARAEELVTDWTARHPLDSVGFVRTSMSVELLHDHRRPGKHGMPQSVANIESSLDDVLQRLTLYAEQTPREVMWQSKLMALETIEHPSVAQTLDDLQRTQAAALRMAALVEGMPALMDAQREAVFQDIAREREATLAVLKDERAVLLDALIDQRLAVMQDVRDLYESGMATIQQERAVVLAQLPDTVAQSMARSDETMRGLIDHLLLRLIELAAGATALLILSLVLWGAWRRRHRTAWRGKEARAHA